MKRDLASLIKSILEHRKKIIHYYNTASPQKRGLLFFCACIILFVIMRGQQNNNGVNLSNTIIKPEIETLSASSIDRIVYAVGQTKASRVVSIVPEASGKVREIIAKKGLLLKKDDVIIKIEGKNQSELLDQAKARLEQKELEYKGSEKLAAKGFKSETSGLQVKADLEAAKAELASAQREYDKLTIRAPYESYLESLNVEKGDVISPQAPIGKITDLTSIEAHFNLSEENIHKISPDSKIQVKIKNVEQPFTANIHYISKSADPKTRTYAVEVLLDNPEHTKIFDGQTCEATITTETIQGYTFPLSAINLDEGGVVGIKIVDGDTVKFLPITVIEIKEDAIIATGIPEQINLIRYGGDFINHGEKISLPNKKSDINDAIKKADPA